MPHQKTYLQLLEKLISFDTTSRNSNLELVTYLKKFFESYGATCSLTHDATKKKANIFATLPSQTGNEKGGIILSGHLDTVPVEGQEWDTNPFTATPKGDRIYGRGTCDMKGFIAVCMSLVPEFAKMPRSKPIHFAWTYDEEIGCLGGRVLTAHLKSKGLKADGCLVGEPTSNKVVVASKGICVWNVTVRGFAAHSSFALTKKGCNAIDYAAKLIVKIREIAEEMQAHGPSDTFFDVPFTTMSTNMINGGNAMNTIPATCNFTYEFRNLPAMTQESIQHRVHEFVQSCLLPSMKKEYSEASISISSVAQVPPTPDSDEKNPFTVLLRTLTGDRDFHKLGCATEGGQYAGIGIPVVICGPGDIAVAHQPNEFVPLKDLAECQRIVRELIQKNQSTSHI